MRFCGIKFGCELLNQAINDLYLWQDCKYAHIIVIISHLFLTCLSYASMQPILTLPFPSVTKKSYYGNYYFYKVTIYINQLLFSLPLSLLWTDLLHNDIDLIKAWFWFAIGRSLNCTLQNSTTEVSNYNYCN